MRAKRELCLKEGRRRFFLEPKGKKQIKKQQCNPAWLIFLCDLILVLQFLHPTKFLLILPSINSLILAHFSFSPWSKKRLQIGLQLVFKH